MKPKKPRKCGWSKCNKMFTPNPFRFNQKTCENTMCALGYVREKKEKKQAKLIDDKVKEMRPFAKESENKANLQKEVNKLARRIDEMFNYHYCIDCGNSYGKQTDAAHFHSIGSNSTLRYNLHNLHSAASQCNRFSDKHHEGYKKGLVKRYGQEYLEMVENLPLKYKEIHLTSLEIVEKLKVVRNLNRNLHTFKFSNAIEAREQLNKIIGIYT